MRIYIVKTNAEASVVRYVRAASQSAAIRAVVAERFSAAVATTEDIVAASKAGALDILDASPTVDDGPVTTEPARQNSRMPLDADEMPAVATIRGK